MGFRAWLSPVKDKKELKNAVRAIASNDDAYGVAYVLKIEKDGTPFDIGDIILAWSGDGNWSLEECALPPKCKAKTYLLDNYLSIVPGWHEGEGPSKFGSWLDETGNPISKEEVSEME